MCILCVFYTSAAIGVIINDDDDYRTYSVCLIRSHLVTSDNEINYATVLTGRITGRARPSVRLVQVPISKTKKCKKTKIGKNVPQGTSVPSSVQKTENQS